MTAAQPLCLCCIDLLAAAGAPTARPEREHTMNSSLSPLGMDCRIWNGVEIQRRPSDGYVNATAMCKANGKHLPHYMANERTGQYLRALSGSVGIPTDLLKQTITTGLNHLRGTWIHPRLAVDLARWISPAFAVWMDGWFLEAAACQQSQVRDTQPVAQPIARPEPTTVLTAPGNWCRLVDDYVDTVEDGMADVPFAQRRRSMRFARPLATHFMQWMIDHHARLELPGPAAQPLPRHQQAQLVSTAPNTPAATEILTGPELARRLNMSRQMVSYWARQQPIGAELHGWRLIGRGKRFSQELGYPVPPGPPSWLFQRA